MNTTINSINILNQNKSEDFSTKKGGKILICEDDIVFKRMLSYAFHEHDFQILTTSSGDEAMQLILEHNPEYIISDIALPVFTGIDISKFVKQNKFLKSKLIFLTSLDPYNINPYQSQLNGEKIIYKKDGFNKIIDEVFFELNLT